MAERQRQEVILARVEYKPRRGLRRPDAALYVGVSTTKFDQLVRDGRMPKPFTIDGCIIWDIRRIDAAIDDLSYSPEEPNPWEDVEIVPL